MSITPQFEWLLQLERPPGAKDFFDGLTTDIFEKLDCDARIEVRCLTQLDLSTYQKVVAAQGNASRPSGSVHNTQDLANLGSHGGSLQLQVVDINLDKLDELIRVLLTFCTSIHELITTGNKGRPPSVVSSCDI
jgi:hypothetical protein